MARTYRSGTSGHTRRVNGRKVAVRGHVRQRPVHHPQPRRAGRNAVRSYKRARRGHYWVAGAIGLMVVLELGGWATARILGVVTLTVLVGLILASRKARAARQARLEPTRESAQ